VQRIYIDTSVLGGYFDDEFEGDTKLFFRRVFEKDFDVYISEISEIELIPAPQYVEALLLKIPAECLHRLEFTKEAQELAQRYLQEKILGPGSLNDAYHIALATVNRIDVLVSWNFKHIVNLDKIILFNAINMKHGYPPIDIRAPKELIRYED
jgi:predicted nucleic acid-binding protein